MRRLSCDNSYNNTLHKTTLAFYLAYLKKRQVIETPCFIVEWTRSSMKFTSRELQSALECAVEGLCESLSRVFDE